LESNTDPLQDRWLLLYGELMTREDILQIREEYISRDKSRTATNIIELAKRYKVSQNTIRKIALRQVYKDVD